MCRKIALPILPLTTALCLLAPSPALAELPPGARAMIDTAIEGGDKKTMGTVIELAKKTWPEHKDEIDAMLVEFKSNEIEKEIETTSQQEAEFAAAKAEAIAKGEPAPKPINPGLFDNWKGRGQLGAFRSTGNASNTGITAGLTLERVGDNWRHKLSGLADYQRSNGVTTREQFVGAYEVNYNANESRTFAYGLAQWERDRFQGFKSRYTGSMGSGWRAFDETSLQLALKSGAAFRYTQFVDGTTTSALGMLLGLDLDWQVSNTLKFTQDASGIFEADNSTLSSTTALTAGLGGGLSASLSYTVEHETDPPDGKIKTDTLTRATLIYDF